MTHNSRDIFQGEAGQRVKRNAAKLHFGSRWYTPVLMAGLDIKTVRHALETARQNGFAEVEIASGESRFSATLMPTPKSIAPQPTETSSENELKRIESPCVGYFADGKNLLQVGTKIKKGDLIAIISALGLANDVEAKVTGEIAEVHVEPNQPVQYGQLLALVRPE